MTPSPRAPRTAVTLFLIAVVAALAVLAQAAPVPAATGVRGHLDVAEIDTGNCYGGGTDGCYYRSYFTVSGWAYNPSTIPNQQVRFVVTGPAYTACCGSVVYQGTRTFASGAVVANRCRADVQRAFGLSYCDVGYATNFSTTLIWGAGTKVCAQARDHGSSQAWIGVGCLTADVYWFSPG